MQTSIHGVYACGDIAEFSGAVPGLIIIATTQGETAGINASGGNSVYRGILPSPMTKVAGISILSIGSIQSAIGAQVYRKIDSNDYAMAVVSSGKVIGTAFIGNTAYGMKLKKLMESGGEIGPVTSYDDIEKTLEPYLI